MSSSQIRNLARRIHILERDRIQRKQANLGYSTIDGGALQAQDNDDNLTMIIGQQHDGTNTAAVVTGPTPPQPTVPVITAGPGMLRVFWGGTFMDGSSAPMDFTRVTVHAVPTATFEEVGFNVLDQAYIVGAVSSAMGGEVTAGLGLEEHTVYLVSWSQAGKFSAISPTALGTPGDLPVPSVPPSASPTLKAVGMPTVILLVTDPIAQTDFLTFQYSADGTTGWTDLDNMPTRQNIWTADEIPGGSPFVIGTEYFFRVIAGNSAGSAAPSNIEAAQLDTAAIALVASQVVTAELISEAISAGVVNVGSNISISADGGITILQSDGGITRLPTDGSSPTFTGAVVARSLTVENGASIYGTSDVSGTIDLNAAIKDPSAAPTVDAYYDVRDMAAEYGESVSSVGLTRNLADDGWVTIITAPDIGVNRWRFLEVLDDNTVNTYIVTNHGQNAMGGIVQDGSFYYYMYRTSAATWWGVKIADLGSFFPESGWPQLHGTTRASRPGLGVNAAGDLLVATIGDITQIRIDNLGPDDNWAINSTVFLASGVTTNTDINGVHSDPLDYLGVRHVIQYSTGVRVYNTTPSGGNDGTYVSADGWAKPYGWTPNGLHWDGTYFRMIDPFGRIARLEPRTIIGDSQPINGTFDANTTGWAASALGTLAWEAGQGHIGMGAAKLTSTAGSAEIRLERQATYPTANSAYTYGTSAWVWGPPGRTAKMSVDFLDAALAQVGGTVSGPTITFPTSGQWVRVEVTATPGAGTVWAKPKVALGANNVGDVFYVDDIQIGRTLLNSYWAYSWVDSDTHTTLPSPLKQWTPPNRSLVTVTSSTPPQAADPGTHVANRIQVYATTHAVGSTLYEQGGHLPVGIVAWPYNPIREQLVAAPGSSNWSSVAVPGEVRSDATDDNGRIILLQGDGDGRVGPYAWTAALSEGPPIGSLYEASGSHVTSLANSTIVALGASWTGNFPVGTGAGAMFSTAAAGVWTMAFPGAYAINATVSFAANAVGRRVVLIYINGSQVRRVDVGSGGLAAVEISHFANLVAGDTIGIRAFQSSGGALLLDGASVPHTFQMMRVG